MKTISRDTFVYAMSPNNKPALHLNPGDRVEFETWDALQGQIKSADQGFDELDWTCINPATGPVFINGAEPGDVLTVKIDSIEVGDTGVVLCGQGMGIMGEFLSGASTKIIPIKDDVAHFSNEIKIPLNKMIGVIGVAPESGEIPCGVPDLHGGNMDCKEVREGATIMLPVYVPGALLALGDLHAVMADGEIGVSGLEVSGKVRVTVDVIKNKKYPLPMIENDDYIMTLASDEDLDKAVDMAVVNMIKYLTEFENMNEHDAVMLHSLIADVKICQVVDPKKTIRVEFPKKYLRS